MERTIKNDSWNGVDTYVTGLTRNEPARFHCGQSVNPPDLSLAKLLETDEPLRFDEEEVFSRPTVFPRRYTG